MEMETPNRLRLSYGARIELKLPLGLTTAQPLIAARIVHGRDALQDHETVYTILSGI